MKKIAAIWLLFLTLTLPWSAFAEDPTGADVYSEYVARAYTPTATLRLETGFRGLSCTPNDFVHAIQSTIDDAHPDEDGSRYRAALSALGLWASTATESFLKALRPAFPRLIMSVFRTSAERCIPCKPLPCIWAAIE